MTKSQQLQDLVLQKIKLISKKDDIKKGDEYATIMASVYSLQKQAESLFDIVSTKEIDVLIYNLEKEVFDELIESGETSDGVFELKKEVKKEVNIAKLRGLLDNDMDMFCQIAKVTQKSLNEFSKGYNLGLTKEYKVDFKGCVEIVSEEAVGIKPIVIKL